MPAVLLNTFGGECIMPCGSRASLAGPLKGFTASSNRGPCYNCYRLQRYNCRLCSCHTGSHGHIVIQQMSHMTGRLSMS